jgi:alpha-glucosidase
VEGVEGGLPELSWPVYTGSNHDAGRLATRWAGGDEAKARCALLMLLTLRGTPFLYYGDEIALPDGDVPPERRKDPVPDNRDGCRTPMPWTPDGGFTDGGDP